MADSPSGKASGIPPELQSDYPGGPFARCTRCGESLLDMPEGYQVSKNIRGGETIWEFALCHECHDGIIRQFSLESRIRLDAFHRQNVLLNQGRLKCAVCCAPRGEGARAEYSLTAAFSGTSVISEVMFCGGCRERMQALLSEQTRGVWGRFVNDNLPGVPADEISPTELIPA